MSTFDITEPFNTPLFSGSGSTPDVPSRYPVAIAGRPYLIDVREYRRRTIPALREAQDTTAEPGEQSLNNQAAWSRFQIDWRDGAGQRLYDAEGSNRARFFSSDEIDCFSNRNQVTLCPRMLGDTPISGTQLDYANILFANSGIGLITGTPAPSGNVSNAARYNTTIPNGSLALSAPAPITVFDATPSPDRTIFYLATGDGLYTHDPNFAPITRAASAVGSASGQLQRILNVNGRLVGVRVNGSVTTMVEVATTGAETTFHTFPTGYPNVAGVGLKLIDGSKWFYLLCGGTARPTTVWGFTANNTGGFTAPFQAMQLPTNEDATDAIFYAGFLIIASNRGVRLCTQGSDGTFTYGPLNESLRGPLCGDGRFVYCTLAPSLTSNIIAVARMDLARFTEPLVPAWACDAVTTVDMGTTGLIFPTAIARDRSGRTFLVITNDLASQGIVWQTPNNFGLAYELAPSGTFDTGLISFGTIETKAMLDVTFRHEPLPAGASVVVETLTEDGLPIGGVTSNVAGSTGPASALSLNGARYERIRLRFTLNRGSVNTTGPTLTRWQLRGVVAPRRSDVIEVPIVAAGRLSVGGGDGTYEAMDVIAEYRALVAIAESGQVVNYQEGASVYSARIEAVEVRPIRLSEDNTFFEGLIVVTLITV